MRMTHFIVTLVAIVMAGCSGSSSGGTSSSPAPAPAPAPPPPSSETPAGYPDYNTSPLAPDMSGMESTAVEIAAEIRLGWNIGNTMEAIGGETAWGNPEITGDLLALVKDSGFDAVRIPVSWNQYADEDTAEIDAAWLDRVAEVVELALANDLYAIVNIHWDGGWLEENVTPASEEDVAERQRALWQQIATRLRDFDGRVMFAGTNEPNVDNAQQMAVLETYLQTFIDAVRETGGRNAYRTLIIQGPRTDIELTDDLWTRMPVDQAADRLMMEIHYYTPYQFTLMTEDADWGRMFYYWGEDYHSPTDTNRNADWGQEETVNELFDVMQSQFVDNGIPVILGEYSAMRRTDLTGDDLQRHMASRAYWHAYVTRAAVRRGLIPFYWDAGGLNNHSSGIFDRDNETVFDQQTLEALKLGAGQ